MASFAEVWTAERCFIAELLNDPASPEVSLALARVEPGVTTQLHRLEGVTERYVLRRGCGTVEIDGIARPVAEGDAVLIPAGATQRITSDGAEALKFFCLCTPRFVPECYVALGP